MRTMIQKIVLLVMMFSLSVLAFSQNRPAEHSILRLSSENFDGQTVYAVAMADGSIKALTSDDADYKLENSLWFVKYPIYGIDGATLFDELDGFTLQNIGTGLYLNFAERDGVDGTTLYYLVTSTKPCFFVVTLFGGYGIGIVDYIGPRIHYDPYYNEWRCYESFYEDYNRNESQGEAEKEDIPGWDSEVGNQNFPPIDLDSSLEIEGEKVEGMVGGDSADEGSGDLNFEDIVDNLDEITDPIYKEDVSEADPKPIVVGDEKTYPKGYWKTDIIQLNITYVDWTPVSFPVDVKCVTADLSGVGYQEYSTANRAAGKSAWETKYVTPDKVFLKGVAYNFATDSEVMTLEFKPTTAEELTKIEKSYSNELTETNGSVTTNQNWYYIGNALFVDAGLSSVEYACVYNRSNREYVELNSTDLSSLDPFATFFVQYAGEYTMSSSTVARSSAPMLAREKSIAEKYYLKISGEGEEDQTGIFFKSGASAEGYVIGEDFLSFATIGGATTEIYTYEDDINFSFNERPLENTFVRVGLYIAKAGTYTISLDNISGNAETFVLYDNYEGEYVYLHLGEEHTFSSEKGEFNDRFDVTITYAPGVTTDNVSLSANKLVVVNKEIQGLALDSELFIYDSTGRLVYTTNVYSESMLLPDLNSGIYIARNGNGWAKFLVK